MNMFQRAVGFPSMGTGNFVRFAQGTTSCWTRRNGMSYAFGSNAACISRFEIEQSYFSMHSAWFFVRYGSTIVIDDKKGYKPEFYEDLHDTAIKMRHKFDTDTMVLALPSAVERIIDDEFNAAIRALGNI